MTELFKEVPKGRYGVRLYTPKPISLTLTNCFKDVSGIFVLHPSETADFLDQSWKKLNIYDALQTEVPVGCSGALADMQTARNHCIELCVTMQVFLHIYVYLCEHFRL